MLTRTTLIATIFAFSVLVVTPVMSGCATTQAAGSSTTADPLANAISHTPLDKAHEMASEQNRLLLIFSTADWCGPCRRMKADTWTNPHIGEWVGQHALVYYLDVDEEGPLSDELSITSIPTMIAYSDGEEIARITGNHGPASFLDWLNDLPDHRADAR